MCRAIEETVRRECADIVIDALVVGSSRLHPALIVETVEKVQSEVARQELAAEIVGRIAGASRNLFTYERIADPKWVIVVDKGQILRNKVSID